MPKFDAPPPAAPPPPAAAESAKWPPNPFEKDPNYDAERKPNDDVELVSQEQLKRSEEIERMGVDKWMALHDTRPEAERPKAVQGIAPPPAPEPHDEGRHSARK